MQLKLRRKLTLIFTVYLILLVLLIAYVAFSGRFVNHMFLAFLLIAVISIVFLVWFNYTEKTMDQKIITSMVVEGNIALVNIQKGTINKIMKTGTGHNYPIWDITAYLYDKDNQVSTIQFCDKFNASQTSIPNGYVYITYDPNKPEQIFIVPNPLLGISDESMQAVQHFESIHKDIKYLNCYYSDGIVLETMQQYTEKLLAKN